MRVLVTYATRHGSTTAVAETVADVLRANGHEADLCTTSEVRSVEGYRAAVVGAPLYSMRWLSAAPRFLKRHRREMATLPVAVFALGPRADTAEAWARSREQLDRALGRLDWLSPVAVALFGGADPPGKGTGRDIRDWHAIRAWAGEVSRRVGQGEQAPPPDEVAGPPL